MEELRRQIEENEKEEEQMKLEYEEKLAAALANKVNIKDRLWINSHSRYMNGSYTLNATINDKISMHLNDILFYKFIEMSISS